MCGHLFWNSRMSSEREVNSGVGSYIAESATRIWRKWLYDVKTLYHKWPLTNL